MATGPKRILIAVAVALVTIAGGVIHGRLEHRWGSSEELAALGTRLEELPVEIGSWRLTQRSELTSDVQQMLRCAGYVNRTYVNSESGAIVRVAVLVGPTAPIAIHTPEICFTSRSVRIHEPRRRVKVPADPGESDEFWHSVFRSEDGLPDELHVFYGWSTGSKWSAPENQRTAFFGAPWLFKIQLASRSSDSTSLDAEAVGRAFLEQFLPALQRLTSVPKSPM